MTTALDDVIEGGVAAPQWEMMSSRGGAGYGIIRYDIINKKCGHWWHLWNCWE